MKVVDQELAIACMLAGIHCKSLPPFIKYNSAALKEECENALDSQIFSRRNLLNNQTRRMNILDGELMTKIESHSKAQDTNELHIAATIIEEVNRSMHLTLFHLDGLTHPYQSFDKFYDSCEKLYLVLGPSDVQ